MEASSLVRVKKEEEEEEEDDDLEQGPHSHQFKVKFPDDSKKYTIYCDQARTALEAIKSHLSEQFRMMKDKKRNYSDEKIIIQRSDESIVATHFPCSCIKNDECLVIHRKTEVVEETKSQHGKILPKDKYSVFYIITKTGKNARKENFFKSSAVIEFDEVCVYAKKGTSVKEALERDGRFKDLKGLKLSEYKNSNQHTLFTQKVDNLDQKTFKICRDRKPANYANEQVSSEEQEQQEQQEQQGQQGQEGQPSTSKQSQPKFSTKSVLAEAQKSGISVKRAMEKTGCKVNTKEIYKLLREQFQDLKILMESRFPGDSYQKALELKKEDFGKIQQSFSEVHRVRELLKLGESVCFLKFNAFQVTVQGTGFLLFDNFILTNAHLFKMCTDVPSDQWREHVKITGTFNYENPDCDSNKEEFTAKLLGGSNIGLDYAILVLNPNGQSSNPTAETEEARLPPGLLSKFGPLPKDGEACLIGHPAGAVKKIDPTCIIPQEETDPAVRDYIITSHSINQEIRKDPYADIFVTYNSFMYHGASGSPVFDAHGRVFGLHTGGVFFNSGKNKQSMIEYALPLLNTFENFVEDLKKSGNTELLKRVQEAAKGNPYLEQIIERLNA